MAKRIDLNEASRWSNIAQFANTPLARSTIAAPFAAFLIFFNEQLRETFDLQEPATTTDGFWAHILEVRLEIFYLGLVMLGAVVSIYSLTAPRTFKRQPNYSSYLENKLRTKSRNTIAASAINSLRRIEALTGIPEKSVFDAVSDAVPSKVRDALYRMIENEFGKLTDVDIRDENFPEALERFYTIQGYVDVDSVLEVVFMQRRVEMDIWKRILDGNSLDEIDVFRLEYHLFDYSSPNLRKTILCFIALSTALVILPTIITLVSVIGTVFGLN